MMPRCTELDFKLVSTGTGDPVYRARIACEFLQDLGRAYEPVGIGELVISVTDAASPAPNGRSVQPPADASR